MRWLSLLLAGCLAVSVPSDVAAAGADAVKGAAADAAVVSDAEAVSEGGVGAAAPDAGDAVDEVFRVPFSSEHGKYIVLLGTPAGPRRFIFDTGCPKTVIRESLRAELASPTLRTMSFGDFESHSAEVACVRIDSLRLGGALFRGQEVLVLPDSSLVFSCFGIDGIAGCDLLREFVVRMPEPDSTIAFARSVRALGKPARRRSCRMSVVGGCPDFVVSCRNGARRIDTHVRFDTGSPGFYHYSYRADDRWLERGFAADIRWAEGYSSNLGWTNRTVVSRHFRGTVPRFEVAGTMIRDMPMRSTCGSFDILGRRLLDWGRVVLDFPRRRFYFLPAGDAEPTAPPQSLPNFTLWIVRGRLVVGQVWDEALLGVIAPGDRVVNVDGKPWPGGVCSFLFDPEQYVGRSCEIETADGSRVTLPIKYL